ncbi:MAG: 2-hydroxychromene-2-carboxylate isomerase [bacterium]
MADTSEITLEFFYEFASTYSYLSAMRIAALAASHGARVQWRPFLLGPIFRDQGWQDSPFKLYPVKGRYMWRDLERRAARYGLPFRRPSQFPRNGLLAARLALLGTREGWGAEFSRRVYAANFVQDLDIGEASVLRNILRDLGRDAEAVLELAQGEEVKAALRAQTERAKGLGIFGAPSFMVGSELFWGDDRLEDALEWRAGKGP